MEVLGDTPLKTTDPAVLGQFEAVALYKLNEELHSVLTDINIRKSDTQDVAFIDVMKSVSEATIKESTTIEGMLK